jgi:hypothetical protein
VLEKGGFPPQYQSECVAQAATAVLWNFTIELAFNQKPSSPSKAFQPHAQKRVWWAKNVFWDVTLTKNVKWSWAESNRRPNWIVALSGNGE